eukprot:7359097-Pyramimonas_sp.AAC.1
MVDRCRRYVTRVHSIVMYACEGMAMGGHTFEKWYVWEGRFLAIVRGRRKGRDEDRTAGTWHVMLPDMLDLGALDSRRAARR